MVLPVVASLLEEALAEVARFDRALPVARAATPPASWYMSPAVHELELARVFGQAWQLAAYAHQLVDEGAFVAGQLGRAPYVVVRHDGVLRAFFNVCRHHAACVAPAAGRCDAFVCPYHGWSYHLDGRLKSAPRMAGVQGFDKAAMGLRPMAVEEIGSFVFVSPNVSAPSRKETLAPLQSRLDALGTRSLVHVQTVAYEIACDWKVFVDNYLDGGYHVEGLHLELAAQLDLDAYTTEVFPSFSIQTAAGADKASTSRVGESALYAFVYPNLMLNRYGSCLDVNVAVPIGPGRCRVVFDYFFSPAAAGDRDGVAASLAASDVVQRWDPLESTCRHASLSIL